MLQNWILSKLECVKDSPRVLVRDPLRLLRPDSIINEFAKNNNYTAIPASTNLVFRELYENAFADPEVKKILIIDRTPLSRQIKQASNKAPPLFYPDFLAKTTEEARLDLNLRQFLVEQTQDPLWPQQTNESRYAKLMVINLPGVIRAHANLRTADERRFTDYDFKTIIAFAALGVADKAFKNLDPEDLWTIGLLKHKELTDLEKLAPEIIKPIKEQFSRAEAPFCWFGKNEDTERIVRAFYLSAILSQHFENWQLLLANIDPSLKPLSGMKTSILKEEAPRLVMLNPVQAEYDLKDMEDTLSRESLKLLLIDQMKITETSRFASVIEKEGYSTLIRSLALLTALDDLLAVESDSREHKKIHDMLFGSRNEGRFVDIRESDTWSDLKEAYHLAFQIRQLRMALFESLRRMRIAKVEDFSFELFRDLWNTKKINNLEYDLSSLGRLSEGQKLLPRASDNLPQEFTEILDRVKQRIQEVTEKSNSLLDEINLFFQEMVKRQYPTWIAKDTQVVLTSQFIRRCLKPNWDAEKEKAVLFIFDGMRYDIWDELFRPMLASRVDLIKEYPASSLLPSETHITRKAICAGTYPDEFDTSRGEDRLLNKALAKEFRYAGEVEVVNPEGAGTGETVRYRAGNLDVYIFELCDKELHKIKMKELQDGRLVPSRPMAFIYQQLLKDILKHEVMEIVRGLAPGTKIFVTADHGFVRVGREPIWFKEEDLNDDYDCSYLNCRLKESLLFSRIPDRVKDNIIGFTPAQLRIPKSEIVLDRKTNTKITKTYQSIVFPRIGYFFSRRGGHKPDAFTHGGISIQEMLIPMVVMQAKSPEAGELKIDAINGPKESVEGEEIEFSILVSSPDLGKASKGLRVDVVANYSYADENFSLPQKVIYPSSSAEEKIVYQFLPDLTALSPEDRSKGEVKTTFMVTLSYLEGRRQMRRSRYHDFTVRLNLQRIIRRVGNLGNILGLTPKGLR